MASVVGLEDGEVDLEVDACPVSRFNAESLRKARHDMRGQLESAFTPLAEAAAKQAMALGSHDVAAILGELNIDPVIQQYPRNGDWHNARVRRMRTPDGKLRERGVPISPEVERLDALFEWMSNNASPGNNDVNNRATGRFDNFWWAPLGTNSSKWSLLEYVVAPAGEYGDGFARRLVNATRVMTIAVERSSSELARHTALAYSQLIKYATARGRDSRPETAPADLAPLLTLIEGIVSAAGLVSLMTAERVAGMNVEELVDSVAGQIPPRIARRAQMGALQPMVMRGRYMPQLVRISGLGGVEANPIWENALLKSRRSGWVSRGVDDDLYQDLHASVFAGATGLGCPVAPALGHLTAGLAHVLSLVPDPATPS